MNSLQVLNLLSTVSALVPVGVAFFRYRAYPTVLRTAAVLMLVGLGFEFVFVVLRAVRETETFNDLPLAHAWVAVSTALLGWVYVEAFANDRRLQTAVRAGVGVVLLLVGSNALPVPAADGLWRMPSQALTAQSLLFTVLALGYFYRRFTAEQPVAELGQSGFFWVNSGVLIYYAVNFFAFALWNRMIGQGQGQLSNVIHLSTNLIVNLFYAYGLFCQPKPTPN